MVQWLVKEHLRPAGVDVGEPRIRANLKALAEFAKVQLSSSEEVVLRWGALLRGGRLVLPVMRSVRSWAGHVLLRCYQG